MRTISIVVARAQLNKILDEVMLREKVNITRQGQPIARIEAVKKQLMPIPDMSKFRARFTKAKISSLGILRQLRDEGK